MRPVVTAFALGFAALALVAYGCAAAVSALAAAEGWGSFRIAAGPVVALEFERSQRGTETTLGPGLAVVGLAGGALNAAAAAVLVRSRRV